MQEFSEEKYETLNIWFFLWKYDKINKNILNKIYKMAQLEQLSTNNNQDTQTEAQEEIINMPLPQFESIWESIENQEAISYLYETFESYIWEKLNERDNFSESEKNAIKIVLWWDFQTLFSTNWALWEFMDVASRKVQSMLSPLTEVADAGDNEQEKKTSWEKLTSLAKTAEKMIANFQKNPENNSWVLEYLDLKIWKQVESLKQYKQENPSDELENAHQIQTVLSIAVWKAQSNSDILDSILSDTESLWASLEQKWELWEKLAKTIDSLPFDFWKKIKDRISKAMKDFPLIGFILSMLFWEGKLEKFLSGENKKREKSLKNLLAFGSESNSPIANIFPQWFEDSFDIESLDWFFKYVESEEIDHTKENFWEEIITGKTENPKILEISSILKWEYWEKIFASKDSEDGWAWFAKKLNSVPKLIADNKNQKSQLALDAQIAALPPIVKAQPATINSDDMQYISINPSIAWVHENHPFGQDSLDTFVVENEMVVSNQVSPDVIKQYTKSRNGIINQHIKTATSFPINIDYGELADSLEQLSIESIKTIDFQDGKLMIWDDLYSIDFGAFTHKSVKGEIKELEIIWNPEIVWQDIMFIWQTEKLKAKVLGLPIGQKEREQSITKIKAAELVVSILEKGEFSDEIPAWEETSKIPYNLVKIY